MISTKQTLQTIIEQQETTNEGKGLVSVVKRITEALGGTITFESKVSKGTTFIIRLPQPKK